MGPKIVSTAASIPGIWGLSFGGDPPGRVLGARRAPVTEEGGAAAYDE